MTRTSGVRAHARQILPIPPVRSDIIINELSLEVGGPVAPIQTKFMNQTACYELPASIRHVPRRFKLFHARIDDWILRFTMFPLLKPVAIKACQWCDIFNARKLKQTSSPLLSIPMKILPPQHLKENPVSRVVGSFPLLIFLKQYKDPLRTQAS